MFHQTCTADQTDKVEFLDVNHFVITEDNFGFLTKTLQNLQRMAGSNERVPCHFIVHKQPYSRTVTFV